MQGTIDKTKSGCMGQLIMCFDFANCIGVLSGVLDWIMRVMRFEPVGDLINQSLKHHLQLPTIYSCKCLMRSTSGGVV